MRTTVDLDDDVAAAIQRLRRERGMGLSEAINALVRRGLAERRDRALFTQRTARMGLGVDVNNIAEALELLGDEPDP
jgi:Arc/MetJ family transcription regulator